MAHVHSAIDRNLKQHEKAIQRARLRTHKEDLQNITAQIHEHNRRVKMDFEDIFNQSYAHDEHIYQAILKENQVKNQAIAHLIEQNPELDPHDITFSFDQGRKLTLNLAKNVKGAPTAQKFNIVIKKMGD
jgi:hypothetical protein